MVLSRSYRRLEAVMGLTRKLMSVSTLGAVDYRSDKERIARSTAKTAKQAKRTAKEAKKQTEILARQAEASETTIPDERTGSSAAPRQTNARDGQAPGAQTLVSELTQLAALRDSGALSDAEFDEVKSRLLGRRPMRDEVDAARVEAYAVETTADSEAPAEIRNATSTDVLPDAVQTTADFEAPAEMTNATPTEVLATFGEGEGESRLSEESFRALGHSAISVSWTRYLGGWSGHPEPGRSDTGILRIDKTGAAYRLIRLQFRIPLEEIRGIELEAKASGEISEGARVIVVRTKSGSDARFEARKMDVAKFRAMLNLLCQRSP
jgi:hypothetical protein